MFVVDTNVFAHAANAAAAEHARCRTRLEAWREGQEPWGTTWSVLYEFLRVVTHPRVLPKPLTAAQAWSFVEATLASPSFRVLVETDRHPEVAAHTLAEIPLLAGNVLHDVHTAAVMREHGVRRIWTRDARFHRFLFVEVCDPMGPDGDGAGATPRRPERARTAARKSAATWRGARGRRGRRRRP